jgi:radical SAM superfamily enzyme YgiQ (UPF0313 family)
MAHQTKFNEEPNVACSIALISILNLQKNYALNKDLNGGFGTADDYRGSMFAGILRCIKIRAVHIPVISFAYLQAILKQKGFRVRYFEGRLPDPKENAYDIIILNGSIVDYKHENEVCRVLKNRFPTAKVGFIGEFPSTKPGLFEAADFVIVGEAELFFMNDFKDINQLKGLIKVTALTDYDALPTPDLEGFHIQKYCYSFFVRNQKMITYQASKGCPYSCSYYCTYGWIQGPKIRQRSARKIVQDIATFAKLHGINYIQFRDPVFGLARGFIEEFCHELKTNHIRVHWGMETRLDLLTRDNIDLMHSVGLRLINAGIETINMETAKRNKRPLIEPSYQEDIVRYCREKGVNVSAFYILGLDSDTTDSMARTLKYAMHLNTPVARFSIATPYPGTSFFSQLEKEGRILTEDYEKYTQFNLVFKHPLLTNRQLQEILISYHLKYYLRIGYLTSIFLTCFAPIIRKKPSEVK